MEKENDEFKPAKKQRRGFSAVPSKLSRTVPKMDNGETVKGKSVSKAGKTEPSIDRVETTEAAPASEWDVEGHYEVSCEIIDTVNKKFIPMAASGSSFKVFYWTIAEPCQLYAIFETDGLKGILRFGQSSMSTDCQDLEDLCALGADDRPGPEKSKWTMAWRGNSDDGKTLGEISGGEVDWQFPIEVRDSACGFVPITMTFPMKYNGKNIVVTASKCAELAAGEGSEAP